MRSSGRNGAGRGTVKGGGEGGCSRRNRVRVKNRDQRSDLTHGLQINYGVLGELIDCLLGIILLLNSFGFVDW